MASLFPLFEEDRPPPIAGLVYRNGYITADEEAELVAAIDRMPWNTDWERRRQPYGGEYGLSGSSAPPLPEWGVRLAERIFRDHLTERPFDQMLVNEYQPGQGIALHRDYEPYDRTVASLSLLSSCVMDFRRVADRHRRSMLLEPRSLLVLSDEARYDWEHGIARRKTDVRRGTRMARSRRLSITFRSVKVVTH